MIKTIKLRYENNPLGVIITVALLFRLLAAIFSKGYGMHDDHFLVIESAQSWVDNTDYNKWLPSSVNEQPSGHSFFYPGLHYLLFRFLEFLGLHDPQGKMYIVRLIHALWSLIIVFLGYKIALRKGGEKAAKMAGWLLAILFFMPMMSVRNLVEFACIPFLLIATWLALSNEENEKFKPYFLSGLFLSMAFSTRFQTVLFICGFMLVFLLQKKWKNLFYAGIGFVAGLAVIQSVTDILIWKKPFVELAEYIRYNIENAETYNTQKWYNYLLLISGIFIPPISLFIIFGFIRGWRRHLLLFLPAFIFFVFHSSFPNKQERFILPVLPFIIILGSIGWSNFISTSVFWARNTKLYRACWIFFIGLNTIPLIFISVAYSHKSRVEAMVYLSAKKDLANYLVEESNHDDFTMLPRYYLNKWEGGEYYVTKLYTEDSLRVKLKKTPPEFIPNYAVFVQPEDLDRRVSALKKVYPELKYEVTIEPGFIDKVMTRLNHHNANYTCFIYSLGKPDLSQ